ncbi:MAG: hypothetical protein ACRDDZ_05945 [Marinifilaceae bacterium]
MNKKVYRVSDFETAIAAKEGNYEITSIDYQEGTLNVLRVFGHVVCAGRRIKVTWNTYGKAFVITDPCPEFDLNLE